MVDRTRKMVLKEKCGFYVTYSTLGEILTIVNRLIEDYGKDAVIHSYCDSYSNSEKEYLHVMATEPETDDEMAYRIHREETWEKVTKERDRENYERLSKIYGEKK